MRCKVIERIINTKIIAIARGMEERAIIPLAEALFAGGISMMEITFNQAKPESFESTAAGIRALREKFGEKLLAGAGTVITPALVDLAFNAGALYIVSPDTNTEVIKRTKKLGLVSLPGAMTPGECLTAHNAGADFVKLFPASELGPGYLKAIRAPLSHIRFLAVGGINEKNAAGYIRAGAEGIGVGGNLVNRDWISAGEWDRITALARTLVESIFISKD
ncbi:MAG: bifunctional 4-hydroxy-2-oxoglutarate aldolase/2-dehydro-3-deoxy-phosphogluconate aldolase [Treponema sp.]|jgi:2-dehydro-3-deoxyphosphogluconate aldolase/(4S)-4-hydroxy-2-oxoglutarate aldolase|nr:bifunctional 4-hydroxy-2-oxoglutarate aldolase/2-dehydro-3-deoxy-phosphogluconate aldolase [Treponema sp.]